MTATVTIAGVAPRAIVVPRDRDELASVVRSFGPASQTFAFSGGGSELELGNAPRSLDVLVRTTALDRVIEYSPEDQTITVEAGMTVAALDRVLGDCSQMLPIDVGDRTRSTVGGAIAVNAFGARRHRYGAIKDLIVGIEIVRPDGTPARGGGKVVKNVAGFDIPKLMVGSLGTLGAIVAATFRVFPQTRADASVAVIVRDLPPSTGPDPLAVAIVREQLEPVAIVTSPAAGRRDMLVTFAGDAAAVEAQAARLLAVAATLAPSAGLATAADIAAFAAREIDARSGAWRLRAGYAPARGPAPDAPWLARSVGYPTLGAVFAAGDDSGAPLDELAAWVEVQRAGAPGGWTFHAMPQRWRGTVDTWGPPPPSFALMRALKAGFDPDGRCNPGRFIGGL
jgi:glycolate oxidase FAD binding subunit